jgi:thiamine biosynthesis lipoprotein
MVHSDAVARNAVRSVYPAMRASPVTHTRKLAAMGGTATILIVGGTSSLLDEAEKLVQDCEGRWSRFLDSSEVSQLNWAEGAPVVVDPTTIRLIRSMIDGYVATSGDYDPTLLPALVAAGYAASRVDPTRATNLPDSVRAPGDLLGVVIAESTVTLPFGTTLDAGGIGKGLAADLVCELVMSAGAWGVMAELGGDIVVSGESPEGIGWSLGVENPFDVGHYSALLRLRRGALVTSSQRKRRFVHDGRVQHHLLNAVTGLSAATDVQTVSVIADTGARAEALTKPGFLRDTKDYLGWLPSMNAAGLVIDASGVALASANWGQYA